MTRFSHSKPSPAAGFTLLELMVSAALIGVIMMIMLMATTTSMAIWRNSERAIVVDREGRNAASLMADDFANMLAVAEDAPDYLQPQIGVWKDLVFAEFFVLRSRDYQADDGDNNGDLCYVRYRYRDKMIERATADSQKTFEALRNKTRPATPEYEVLAVNLPGLWVNAYGESGKALNPETSSQDIKLVRFAGLSLQTVDEEEARNKEKGVELRAKHTSSDLMSSEQYFSSFYKIPRP